MNYTVDGLRKCYLESKKKEEEKANEDLLHKLGYSDSDILKKRE